MQATSCHFYARLPINQIPISEMFLSEELFCSIPRDWHVIITDIKGSSQSVLAGKHHQINLIATGSTVTVLNIAFNNNISIPFFYGGDGATFIVPPSMLDQFMQALWVYKTNTLINFRLELRIGEIPVEKIYTQGCSLKIAKYSNSNMHVIPVVLGEGLSYAEILIKGESNPYVQKEALFKEPDLTGMLCRWDDIPAPEGKEEVVTLLVTATIVKDQSIVFSTVMSRIEELFGSPSNRQPISISKLRLKSTFTKLDREIRSSSGKTLAVELIPKWYINLLGYFYFHLPAGISYLKSLVEMSETLLIDGRINTVISGSKSQRRKLKYFLDEMEEAGVLLYGMHVSNSSIMSCYVRNPKDGHIYFVDGAEGGYTMASHMLKMKQALISDTNSRSSQQ